MFEHKSYVPSHPHLQLLRYMLGMWEAQIRNHEPLKLILPIIIYHGQQKWNAKPFADYFVGPDLPNSLEPFIPSFEYWLTDLQASSDGEIRTKYSPVDLRISFLLMKHIGRKSILTSLPVIFEGVHEMLENEVGRKYFEVLFVNLCVTTNLSPEKLKQEMEAFDIRNIEIPIGSTAWQMMQEGVLKVAKNMLQMGLSVDVVAKATELSLDQLTELKKQIS